MAAIFLVVAIIVGVTAVFRGGFVPSSAQSERLLGVTASADRAVSWTPRVRIDDREHIGRTSVYTIVQHPREEGTWYLGTRDAGMYITTDEGATWRRFEARNGPSARVHVNQIAFSPHSPEVLFLATFEERGALLRSLDGGATFTEVYRTGKETSITVIRFDPSSPERVYVTTGDGTILRSDDGGTFWHHVHRLQGRVLDFAANPVNATELFAVVERRGLVRSRDGGNTWETPGRGFFFSGGSGIGRSGSAGGVRTTPSPTLQNFSRSTEGRAIVIDRNNPSHLYYAGAHGLIESFDGGETWVRTGFIEPLTVFMVMQDPVDAHTLYASADNLLYQSRNRGQSWAVTGLRTNHRVVALGINRFNTQELFAGLSE